MVVFFLATSMMFDVREWATTVAAAGAIDGVVPVSSLLLHVVLGDLSMRFGGIVLMPGS
jgi:hypothetical protein